MSVDILWANWLKKSESDIIPITVKDSETFVIFELQNKQFRLENVADSQWVFKAIKTDEMTESFVKEVNSEFTDMMDSFQEAAEDFFEALMRVYAKSYGPKEEEEEEDTKMEEGDSDEAGWSEQEEMQVNLPQLKEQLLIDNLGLKYTYTPLQPSLVAKIKSFELAREMESLEIVKDNYGISEAKLYPEYGFALIRIDLKSQNLQINPEVACDNIGLDINQTLNVEFNLNVNRILQCDDIPERCNFWNLQLTNCFTSIQFHQRNNELTFADKFCQTVFRKQFEDLNILELKNDNETSLEFIFRRLKQALQNLNSNCFICLKPLGAAFSKVRTCGQTICEFQFEECDLGNIFQEIKKDPEIAHFLIETTVLAFASQRAPDLTEPFPSFLLKQKELRPKLGNLDYIRTAQQAGTDVTRAAQINKSNKDIQLGLVILQIIYSVIQDINHISSHEEFKQQLNERAELFISTGQISQNQALAQVPQANIVLSCYPFLRYIMTTQRRFLINVRASMIPNQQLPSQNINQPQPYNNQPQAGGIYFNQVITVLEHDPGTEQEFERRKRTVPSIFAFHGTGSDCLYSLQRNGLRNLSNSQFMTSGAAHGAGIYISDNLTFASGYAKGSNTTLYQPEQAPKEEYGPTEIFDEAESQRKLVSEKFLEKLRRAQGQLHSLALSHRAVAIVEMINRPEYYKSPQIFVVTDQADLIVRFYLISDNAGSQKDQYVRMTLGSDNPNAAIDTSSEGLRNLYEDLKAKSKIEQQQHISNGSINVDPEEQKNSLV